MTRAEELIYLKCDACQGVIDLVCYLGIPCMFGASWTSVRRSYLNLQESLEGYHANRGL